MEWLKQKVENDKKNNISDIAKSNKIIKSCNIVF